MLTFEKISADFEIDLQKDILHPHLRVVDGFCELVCIIYCALLIQLVRMENHLSKALSGVSWYKGDF